MNNPNIHFPHIPAIIPSVGNRVIDNNHKQLFDLIRRIQNSVIMGDFSAMASDFVAFEDFARACFSNEERIARAVGFDFTQHDLAHRDLLEKYLLLKDELASRQGSWSEVECDAYLSVLCDWLKEHLEKESKPLMRVLDTHFYDFKPA